MAPQKPTPLALVTVMGLGILAISSSAIFIRLAQDAAVPSLVIAAWRTGLATLFLLPFAALRRRAELARMGRADWGLALLSGTMLGLHFASWITSLRYTSITSSTVLVATVPLWVGLAAPFVLREPLARRLKQGIGLAVLGSVIVGLSEGLGMENGRFILNFTTAAGGSRPLLGNGLALLGGMTAAVYLLIGRRLRQKLSLLTYTSVVYGMAALTLLLLTGFSGQALLGYRPLVYLLFLAMALFPQLIGHTSFNWALSFLPAAFVSVAAISEPVGATLLAILIFQELPGPAALLGSAFILAGVLLASRSAQR